jgi:hypothetical protein
MGTPFNQPVDQLGRCVPNLDAAVQGSVGG